jgi:NADH-quinone oxidoreductase subunit G
VEPAAWGGFGKDGPLDSAPFRSPIENFYMTDPISRASETMAECTAVFVHGQQGKTGTHG